MTCCVLSRLCLCVVRFAFWQGVDFPARDMNAMAPVFTPASHGRPPPVDRRSSQDAAQEEVTRPIQDKQLTAPFIFIRFPYFLSRLIVFCSRCLGFHSYAYRIVHLSHASWAALCADPVALLLGLCAIRRQSQDRTAGGHQLLWHRPGNAHFLRQSSVCATGTSKEQSMRSVRLIVCAP